MPLSHEATVFGLKLGTIVAGFAGGVVSLTYLRGLSTVQSVLAVFTGLTFAVYITPLLFAYFFADGGRSDIEHAIAFVLGLTAMNIIPGIIKLSEIFKNNPQIIFKRRPDEE